MSSLKTHPLEQARLLIAKGKLEQASRVLRLFLRHTPDSAQAMHLLGLAHYQSKRFDEATKLLCKAIELSDDDPAMLNNAGLACLAARKTSTALQCFNQALVLNDKDANTWFNRGNAYSQLNDHAMAKKDFQQALEIDPFFADAHNNLGLCMRQIGALGQAVKQFELCLEIQPRHHYALNNLGLAKQALGQNDAAKSLFEAALEAEPNYVEAHINLAHLLQIEDNLCAALNHYAAAYKLAPDLDFVLGDLAQSKAMVCDWNNLDTLWTQIEKQIQRGRIPCSPFAMLSGVDRADLSLTLAQNYSKQHIPTLDVKKFEPQRETVANRKLKVGYLSSDFKDHPVAYLTVGIIENHNRTDIETFGFAIGRPGDGPLGKRIQKSFDTFVDLSDKSDAQAVDILRSYDIDIAMDITGYTAGCRPSILKARIAPVQVNYYGYPGTMGSAFMDYIIGDKYLMPSGSEGFYQEKIIFMPECHQPNDDKRDISQIPTKRSDHGLPERGFVYCSFNKPYKISPKVFETWMRIIQAVDNSVLWLQSTEPVVIDNLRRAAKRCGVDPQRLIFAGRTATTSEHLARYLLADLFLDTFPYTAHTTANDALWVGLPVLGLSGQTFAARVSESLLSTLGLPDLVMRNLREFEEKAISIGHSPEQISHYKERLARGKIESSLYKPSKLAAWLEKGLRMAYDRFENGLAPDHIVIPR